MKVFHKCTIGGLVNLLVRPTDEPVCASTERSRKLFHRKYCVVFEVPEDNLLASERFDMDSMNETPWDEVRFDIETAEIVSIIGNKKLPMNAEDYGFLVNVTGIQYEPVDGDHDAGIRAEVKKALKDKIVSVRDSGYKKKWLNV